METESTFLIGWEEERAELRAELSRLQEELAESQAEREELQSRTHALSERLSQTVDMSLSLRLEGEQREWKRKLREGKEREARQALLIHKLQNKVVEYRALCGRLEQQVHTAERKKMLRDEQSDALESALIRLEEEQQRSVTLVEVNALLRSQLSQSSEANQALQDDLKKLTADWSKAVEEVGQREIDWHQEKKALTGYAAGERGRLMRIWGSTETLRRQCHAIKTATDKDLWELRAEFSRLSSTLLSLPHPPAVSSTRASAPLSSTPGPMTLEDLDHVHTDLTAVHEENSGLRLRIGELMATVKVQECESQDKEVELERLRQDQQALKHLHSETERSFESVQNAVRNLYRVIVSQRLERHSRSVPNHAEPSDGLSSVLAIIAQAETALQWRHQELQEAEGSLRRLRAENESLEQRIRELGDEGAEFRDQANQRALELKQTQTLLNSEKEMVEGLRRQLGETEDRGEELKKENVRLRVQRVEEEEERRELEGERQRRLETQLMENAQLCERESRSRLELHNLQGALERERLDRACTEKEATETKGALFKARESLAAMSSSNTFLKREVADGRDALEKIAALNESLAHDNRQLSARTLQLEEDLAETQVQMQKFRSDVATLQKELKAVTMETTQLRAHRKAELDSLQQVQHSERELQNQLQTLREEREGEAIALAEEKAKNEELCEQYRGVCEELGKARAALCRAAEQEKVLRRDGDARLGENQQLEETKHTLGRQNEELKQDRQELRDLSATLQKQLAVAQDQASELELQCTQMNTQVHTLLQAKEVLHGEIQCLQAELERDALLRQQQKQIASEERRRYEEETEHREAEIRRLQAEAVRPSQQLRIQEEEQNGEREKWQQEREALNSELGQKDGEVGALKNRIEALMKQNGELSDMVDEKNAELGQLQLERAGEGKALEMRLQQAHEEMERCKTRSEDIQREKEELDQRFLEREERQSTELEITKREKDSLASLLREKEIEIEKKNKDTEEILLNVKLQEVVIETLKTQLEEKALLERKLVALEEQDTQLKERGRAKTKEEERRRREREAEERERELRLRGELRQKEAELEELKDRVEELLREKKHVSWILEEKQANLEKLQNKLTREQKHLELMTKEAKDEMENWKRRAADAEKEKEAMKQTLVDRVERERNNLATLEEEREKLRNVLQERDEEIQKGEDDIMDLKSTIQSLEEVIENERKQSKLLEGQFVMLEEQNSQLMKIDQERLKELAKMEEDHKEQEGVLHRESEQREGEVENLRPRAEETLKEKDDILGQLGERDAELEKLKARLTQEQLTFEQRVKEDDEQKEEWKMRVEELEREIKRLMRLEGAGREREQELRREMSEMGEELKQFRVRTAELDGENKDMRRTTLEQQERLEEQAALLREREQDTHRLRETIHQKEKDENDRVQQGQEDLGRLKERLTEMEQDLKDTQSALDREVRLHKEKDKELLECNQKLQLANAKGDKEEEKVQDLQERSKRLMEELEMLRGKREEWSGELERKSQLLQDSEREVRELKIRVEGSEDENKQLRRSLSQKEGEAEQLQIRLKVRRAEEEKLRSKLEELQREQCSLVEERRRVEKLETQVRELEEERDHLSAELRRRERDVDACKEEAVKEKEEKDMMSFSLKQKEEKLKEVQDREEAAAIQAAVLREEVAALSESKEHARSVIKGQKEENKKIREGLKAGLQEMATLKELLEASHHEGERLRGVLQGRKDDLVRNREDDGAAARLHADFVQVQRLEKKNQDLQAELLLRECELKSNLAAVARERQMVEKREDHLRTLETMMQQKEAELARSRSRIDVVEEHRSDLNHAVTEKSKQVEKLTSRVTELEQELEEKKQDLKKSEQIIESLKKEKNSRETELQERENGFEVLRKELREKEREMDVMKLQVNERTNERFKNMRTGPAKENINEKETEIEKVREAAFREGKARELLQEQVDNATREMKTLRGVMGSLDRENQEKVAQLERDVHHLRESEKTNNKLKKMIYKKLQHAAVISENRMLSHSQTEIRDVLKEEHEMGMLNTQTETLGTDMDHSQWLTVRDVVVHSPQDDGVWELLNERVCAVLLEKQESSRCLREKESEVYALKEQTAELSKDRDRVRAALEKTESMLIHYKERVRKLDPEKQTRIDAAVQVGDVEGTCGEEAGPSSPAEERLCAMQRAVAQLELCQRGLQQRNRHLEQHIRRLKTDRQHLRETLKQVELERGKLRRQLAQSETGTQESRVPAGADELNSLRAHAGELTEQVHRLRLSLAANQDERAEFIDRFLMNSQRLLSLRQDLTSSLQLVTQQLHPAVLQAETERLDRSITEEAPSFTLSQS